MLQSKTTLETFNHNLTKYLIDPISEGVGREKAGEVRKATEIKNVKFSYPKNGLYGLL